MSTNKKNKRVRINRVGKRTVMLLNPSFFYFFNPFFVIGNYENALNELQRMEIAFTARNKFDPTYGDTWTKYIDWCKLTQVEELISLDAGLCETTFKADLELTETWNNSFELNSEYFADIYKSIDYVLSQIKDTTEFNLLAVAFEPAEECEHFKLDNFKFIGYDLLDQSHSTSALTNCGGYEETFNNSELNKNGLIDTYERAVEIKKNLLINNEEEYHADTNLWAVWRHLTIGHERITTDNIGFMQ